MSVKYYCDPKEFILSEGRRSKIYEFHKNAEEPNETFFSVLSKFIYYAVEMNEGFKEFARQQLSFEQIGLQWNWKTIHNELRRKMCVYWLNISDSLAHHERYRYFSREEFIDIVRYVASNDMKNIKDRVYRNYLIEDVCNFLNIKMCAFKSDLKRDFGPTDSPFFDLIFTFKSDKIETTKQGLVTFRLYFRENDHLKITQLLRVRNKEYFDISNQVFGALPQPILPSSPSSPDILVIGTVDPVTANHNNKFTRASNPTSTSFNYVPYNPGEDYNNIPMVHQNTSRKDVLNQSRVNKSQKK